MEWSKWEDGLECKREVMLMASRLGRSRYEVAAMCMVVWAWARKNTVDGHVQSVTLDAIDALVGVRDFGSALAQDDIGWVVVNDGLRFTKWDRHNSNSAKERALASERQANKRAGMSRKCHGASVTKTLPDKIREDKSIYPLNPPEGESAEVQKQEPVLFDAFWDAWPKSSRKLNRAGCLKKWRAQKLDAEADAIMAGLEAWKGSRDWTKSNGEFIPLPATWLNQRRWEAPIEPGKDSESGLIWEQAPLTDAVCKAIDGE